MKTETKEFVRTTIDLPVNLHEKIAEEAEKEKRSRQNQMLYALEKFFETPNGNGKKEKAK